MLERHQPCGVLGGRGEKDNFEEMVSGRDMKRDLKVGKRGGGKKFKGYLFNKWQWGTF